MNSLTPITMTSSRGTGMLPSYVMTNEEKSLLKRQAHFAKDENGETFLVLPPLPIRPGNRGETGRSAGLLAINEWDSKERKQKDVILCDGDAITGVPSFIAFSMNVAAIAKKGHTFPDFNTGEVKQGSLFNGEADGTGDEVGGGVAEMSEEDKAACGVTD